LGIDARLARSMGVGAVSLTVKGDKAIKGIYLVIDNNPGPCRSFSFSGRRRSAFAQGCDAR